MSKIVDMSFQEFAREAVHGVTVPEVVAELTQLINDGVIAEDTELLAIEVVDSLAVEEMIMHAVDHFETDIEICQLPEPVTFGHLYRAARSPNKKMIAEDAI